MQDRPVLKRPAKSILVSMFVFNNFFFFPLYTGREIGQHVIKLFISHHPD